MYKIYKMIKWIVQSKMSEKNNYLVAELQGHYFEGDEKDKAVGNALMLAEKEVEKQKIIKQMLKDYVLRRNNGVGAEGEVSEEEPEGVEEAV